MAEPDASSLSEVAYRRIEEMIVTRVFQPGSMISENQLRLDLKCGRTPIREALQRLKLEGYVSIHPRRGALVTPIDVVRQIELLEVRRPLERVMTALSIERATVAERAIMRTLAKDIVDAAEAPGQRDYLAANRAVHEIRIAGAHNSVLAQTMHVVFGLSRRFWFSYMEDNGSFSDAAALHAAVLTGIADRKSAKALKATDGLLDFLDGLTQSVILRKNL